MYQLIFTCRKWLAPAMRHWLSYKSLQNVAFTPSKHPQNRAEHFQSQSQSQSLQLPPLLMQLLPHRHLAPSLQFQTLSQRVFFQLYLLISNHMRQCGQPTLVCIKRRKTNTLQGMFPDTCMTTIVQFAHSSTDYARTKNQRTTNHKPTNFEQQLFHLKTSRHPLRMLQRKRRKSPARKK